MNDVINNQMAEAQTVLDIPGQLKDLPTAQDKTVFTQSKEQVGDESQAAA